MTEALDECRCQRGGGSRVAVGPAPTTVPGPLQPHTHQPTEPQGNENKLHGVNPLRFQRPIIAADVILTNTHS